MQESTPLGACTAQGGVCFDFLALQGLLSRRDGRLLECHREYHWGVVWARLMSRLLGGLLCSLTGTCLDPAL